MLIESFEHVLDDHRITEIIISDDHSDIKIYKKLVEYFKDQQKVKFYRNNKNLGMSLNKKRSVELATNEWCILFDSDNVIKPDYLDALEACYPLSKDTIYCPDFAEPEFDYRAFDDKMINKDNIKKYINEKMFDCLLNTANYVVNSYSYLGTYEYDPAVKASDTIHFNHLWLKKGGYFFIVPQMRYFHRVHKGSGFLADAQYNLRQAEQTKNLIMQL